MLSYALDVWRVSWITAASKAQSGLLAVPEDTSLQKKERERGGKIFIKFASHRQKLVFLMFGPCGLSTVLRPLPFFHTHTFHCWPVSKAITGRLLHAFMKYSSGSMSYCALIMPYKDKKGGGGGGRRTQTGRHKTIMKEDLIYWDVGTLCLSPFLL